MEILILTKRNIKLFFKDKGLFFTSLITPFIIFFLYVTFLGNVYKDILLTAIPKSIELSKSVINSFAGSQLTSSLLAVICVTLSFSTNFIMVQDKSLGVIKDFNVSPIKSTKLSISYYLSSIITTLGICFFGFLLCLVYLGITGMYFSFSDVMYLVLDIILLVFFGTALSSIVNFFLTSQGQIAAVGTIISAGYGFIAGAYMPIASFNKTLQNIIAFLPGTYGTVLIRNHTLRGVVEELSVQGVPGVVLDALKDSVDFNFYFFNNKVEIWTMYLILILATIFLVLVYILLNVFKKQKIS